MGCCASKRGNVYKALLQNGNKVTRGNEDNAEMLISYILRQDEGIYDIQIPRCINYLCLLYFYENTNVIFYDYDHCNSWNVDIRENGKKVRVSSNTIFIFSDVGYESGYHSWSVKLHNVYNCQALGITEHNDATYRYGYNIFDSELNKQLGDRYIYAGDTNHGWRGSTEMRPYILSASNNRLKYDKKLKLNNNRWECDDVITVECNFNDKQWTIQFFKNSKPLADKINVNNKKMYYPVFQVYQRGTFEIIDY
eukprot:389017_1